jgi:hypothetical protein
MEGLVVIRKTLLLTALACTSLVIAQTTQPTGSVQDVQMRALQAFNAKEYALALPLLKKTADNFRDEPQRLGSIQEMIRIAETNLANPTTKPAGLSANRTPHPAPEAGKVLEMSIKELGNFDYDSEKGGNIPDDVKKLTGSTIRLTGYMMPLDQAERVSRFALMPSLAACCFGEPAGIQHTVVVTCPPGKAVSFYPDEILVEGTLTVDEKKEDGFITSIFQMKTTSVKPAAK